MAGHKELIFTGMLHIRLRTVLGYLKMMLEDKVNLSKVTIKCYLTFSQVHNNHNFILLISQQQNKIDNIYIYLTYKTNIF